MIADCLRIDTCLHTLDLSANALCSLDWDRPEGFAALADSIKTNITLRTLRLAHNGLTDGERSDSVLAMADAVEINQGLHILDLDGHPLSVHDLKGITGRTELDYRGIVRGYSKGVGTSSAVVIAKLLERNSCLRKLTLTDEEMDSTVAKAALQRMAQNTKGIDVTVVHVQRQPSDDDDEEEEDEDEEQED